MKEILKTTLLEYDKSSFLIDIIKHNSSNLYISITQTIHQDDNSLFQSELKINPSILDDIMEVLAAYEKLIPKEQFNKKNYLSKDRKNSITRSYLKGITMKDLALQNNCSENLIEQILTNRGIEIVKEGLKFKSPVWIRRKTKSKKGLFL